MNTAPDTPPTDLVATRLPFVRSALLPVALALGGALVGFVHELLSMRIWALVGDPAARIAWMSEVRVWGGVNVALGAALGLVVGLVRLRGLLRVPPGELLRRCLLPTLFIPLPLAAVPGWAGAALAGAKCRSGPGVDGAGVPRVMPVCNRGHRICRGAAADSRHAHEARPRSVALAGGGQCGPDGRSCRDRKSVV